MRQQLLPLRTVMEALAAHEPLDAVPFTIGDQIHFDVASAWEFGLDAKPVTDMVGVWITIGGGRGKQEFQLSKEALRSFVAQTGMPYGYAERLPAQLLGPQLNYWYREGLIEKARGNPDFKILTSRGKAVALAKQTAKPFSNVQLLHHVMAGIETFYGDGVTIMADPKFSHSLLQTRVRLVLPTISRTITGSSEPNDDWSVGVLLKNSLNGNGKTSVEGYLFRWVCSNGAIDVRNPFGGTWSRGGPGSYGQEADVHQWAQATVGELLAHIDHSLDAVQAMTEVTLQGNVADVLKDVFETYKIRANDRPKIIELLSHHQRITMYEVMQAITQVANAAKLEPTMVETLQRLGGELPHAASSMCDSCRRLSHSH